MNFAECSMDHIFFKKLRCIIILIHGIKIKQSPTLHHWTRSIILDPNLDHEDLTRHEVANMKILKDWLDSPILAFGFRLIVMHILYKKIDSFSEIFNLWVELSRVTRSYLSTKSIES